MHADGGPACVDSIEDPSEARIDEKGDVTVSSTQGNNPAFNDAVRVAVEHWKFLPTVDQNGPRCVETEFPILINSNLSK